MIFAGQWSLYESVKICFACGGRRGTVTVQYAWCCSLLTRTAYLCPFAGVDAARHPQATRSLLLARVEALRLCAGCECCALCVCRVCGHRQPWSRRRAGWRRTSRAAARYSFYVWVDYLLVGSFLATRRAHFLACELDAGRRSARVFLRISRFWCLKTRKKFRPRRGGQSSRSRNRSRLHVGYASSRPKGEIDALPLDFRIRLGSKKSAI